MNLLQINKFSELHDGQSIIFCKTDFIENEFENIKKIKNKVIFITGNSDYCITDDIVAKAPKNIKKWFCQNRLSDNNLLESIPLGIENTIQCTRDGHGFVWPHAIEKPLIINRHKNEKKHTYDNLIYANFNIQTNLIHRSEVKNFISNLDYITKDESNLSYINFVNKILCHEAVLCPQGNGKGDNHRIYETLHLGRIPITFSNEQFKYLHHKFPVVLIQDIKQLGDKDYIKNKIHEAQSKFDNKYLDINYWIMKIKNEQQTN